MYLCCINYTYQYLQGKYTRSLNAHTYAKNLLCLYPEDSINYLQLLVKHLSPCTFFWFKNLYSRIRVKCFVTAYNLYHCSWKWLAFVFQYSWIISYETYHFNMVDTKVAIKVYEPRRVLTTNSYCHENSSSATEEPSEGIVQSRSATWSNKSVSK